MFCMSKLIRSCCKIHYDVHDDNDDYSYAQFCLLFFFSPNFPKKMSLFSKPIDSWFKRHGDGDDDGDDRYDHAPAACMEGDGDDDDGDYDYAPQHEGDDDDDDDDDSYDYAPAA
ncbi:hypothetical protein F0562_030039 [Nyssa sinensis]|uniref:Uncharacterized protein n=1 Tax=Nyssa sinensis TaxID=561372 RepID=A0A5J5AYX6_9ASTE|nr:hypothetical protein F0562_030039 [Nyssa sinensis]